MIIGKFSGWGSSCIFSEWITLLLLESFLWVKMRGYWSIALRGKRLNSPCLWCCYFFWARHGISRALERANVGVIKIITLEEQHLQIPEEHALPKNTIPGDRGISPCEIHTYVRESDLSLILVTQELPALDSQLNGAVIVKQKQKRDPRMC